MAWYLVKHRDNLVLPIHSLPGAPTPGVKRPGREADYSPLSIAEVNAWSYTSSTPPNVLVGVVFN
jgi:hypothetical protein